MKSRTTERFWESYDELPVAMKKQAREAYRLFQRSSRQRSRATAGEMDNSIRKSIKETSFKGGVGEQELRLRVRTRRYSGVRAKIAYFLSDEFGISGADIARQLGVCTSAIAKAIQNIEGTKNKC